MVLWVRESLIQKTVARWFRVARVRFFYIWVEDVTLG